MAIRRRKLSDSSWCKLGDDPWLCIMRKLSFPDLLRFKSVCRSWSSMAEDYVSSRCYRPCLQTPWLLLPSEEYEEEDEGAGFGILSFFNLDEKVEYRDACVCEDVRRGRCVGSSHGFFILLDEKANLSVFNPFSGCCRIPIGSSEVTHHVDSFNLRNDPRSFIHKAAMICNNIDKEMIGVVVVIIYGTGRNLAFSRFHGYPDGEGEGDENFIKLPGAHPPYADVVCNTETNTVSAISETGSVQVWDLNFSTESWSSLPRKIMDAAPPFPAKLKIADSERDLYSPFFYLVESCGELLFILSLVGEYVDGDTVRDLLNEDDTEYVICPYRTMVFHVYRLDRRDGAGNEKWEEIQSLGDRVVFIGGSESFSMRAEDCLGCRKDSIYFTDAYWERMFDSEYYGGHDMGCYSLRDRSFNSFYDHFMSKLKPVPFWFLPHPSSSFLCH